MIAEGKALAHDDSFELLVLLALLVPPTMVERSLQVLATRNRMLIMFEAMTSS